ncbi:MAG: hypothetical protein JWR84_1402 [Caulobacter sp.]|nr:hypothetical protein [Caulobacter sp.]
METNKGQFAGRMMRPISLVVVSLLVGSPLAAGPAAATGLSHPARAPNEKDAAAIVARPVWLQRPTKAQLEAAYPRMALRRNVSGLAVLWCSVRPDGWLRDCRVVSETSTGYGFGQAAIDVSPRYRLASKDALGRRVAGRFVRFSVVFRTPD